MEAFMRSMFIAIENYSSHSLLKRPFILLTETVTMSMGSQNDSMMAISEPLRYLITTIVETIVSCSAKAETYICTIIGETRWRALPTSEQKPQ